MLHAVKMKGQWRGGVASRHILVDVWAAVSGDSASLSVHLPGKEPLYVLDRRLGQPQSRSGGCEGENINRMCPVSRLVTQMPPPNSYRGFVFVLYTWTRSAETDSLPADGDAELRESCGRGNHGAKIGTELVSLSALFPYPHINGADEPTLSLLKKISSFWRKERLKHTSTTYKCIRGEREHFH
jgi:hypothetical protein